MTPALVFLAEDPTALVVGPWPPRRPLPTLLGQAEMRLSPVRAGPRVRQAGCERKREGPSPVMQSSDHDIEGSTVLAVRS